MNVTFEKGGGIADGSVKGVRVTVWAHPHLPPA